MDRVNQHGLTDKVDLHATFCFENCGHSPNIVVDGNILSGVTAEEIDKVFQEEILARLVE